MKSLNLGVISQERQYLFGLAILWIALFHTTLQIENDALRLFKNLGGMGVDIFLFLSGIGLYYSCCKDANPLHFYKKRAIRILISYALICVPVYLGLNIAQSGSVGNFLLEISTLNFWLKGVRSEWFIAGILLLYLVYPLIYRLFKQYRWKGFVAVLGLVLASSALLWYFFPTTYKHWEIFLGRIPVFLVGAFIAPLIQAGRKIKAWPSILGAVALIVVGLIVFELTYGAVSFHRYCYCPISIALTYLLALGLSALNPAAKVKKFLGFWGEMTLEFYLIHGKIISALIPLWALVSWDQHSWWFNLAALVLAAVLAYGVKLFRDYLVGLVSLPKSTTITPS